MSKFTVGSWQGPFTVNNERVVNNIISSCDLFNMRGTDQIPKTPNL